MPSEVSVLLGESVQLLCNATGVPTPDVQWLKDGKTVASDDLQRIRQEKLADTAFSSIILRVLRGECGESLNWSLARLRTSPSVASINQV